MTSKIEISHKTIIFTVAFLAFLWLLFYIRDIIFLLFVSFIIMSALRPMVDFLEQRKIPKIISILFIYIIVVGLVGITVSSLIPALTYQVTHFIDNFPRYVEFIRPYYQIDLRVLTQQIAPIGENIVKFTVSLFSNIITVMTVLVITFYLLLERSDIITFFKKATTNEKALKAVRILESIEYNLGAWLRGELILMMTIGLMTFIGLSFLRIDYVLPLAIIAGFMEIIPVIGPVISAIPAIFIALTVSPIMILAIIALYFLIHQLENNLIVPIVMKRAIDLSPLVTIIALMVGSSLAGVSGAVLAIPIVLVIRSIAKEILDIRKNE